MAQSNSQTKQFCLVLTPCLYVSPDWLEASPYFLSLWLPVSQHSPHPATLTTQHDKEGAATDVLTVTQPV